MKNGIIDGFLPFLCFLSQKEEMMKIRNMLSWNQSDIYRTSLVGDLATLHQMVHTRWSIFSQSCILTKSWRKKKKGVLKSFFLHRERDHFSFGTDYNVCRNMGFPSSVFFLRLHSLSSNLLLPRKANLAVCFLVFDGQWRIKPFCM